VPVLVTAAHQPLARRLAARLLEEGGEVRVFADGDVGSLRAAGAFVSMGTADDEGRLEAALADVHTLVHLGGALPLGDPDQVLADARVVVRAATNAGVRRVLLRSLPGAEATAADPMRRALAEVEGLVAQVPCPTVVIRAGLVDTPQLRDALVTGGLGDALDVEVAPLRGSDLLELVAAFDRARSSSSRGHLLVSADGPLRTSVAGYLDRVGAATVGRGPLVGRRLPDPEAAASLASVLRGPWWSTDPTVLNGWDFAGIEPTVPGPGG
jgi:hypothetical protein